MTARLRAGERDEAATRPGREPADPLLAILVTVDLLLFAGVRPYLSKTQRHVAFAVVATVLLQRRDVI